MRERLLILKILFIFFSKYVKAIEVVANLVQNAMIKGKGIQKKRIDNPKSFYNQRENYALSKAHKVENKLFPEPTYFTTTKEFYEYSSFKNVIPVSNIDKNYNLILFFAIPQCPIKQLHDLFEFHKINYHLDFENTLSNNPVKLIALLWGVKNNSHSENKISNSGNCLVEENLKQKLMY